MELLIHPGGDIRCLYGEEIDLAVLGRLRIERGSHVEPTPDGRWTVDLEPVGGPVLLRLAVVAGRLRLCRT